MEDAAGVVRRIILLWCEVIFPPCPPSLSSSQVYFWLAASCVWLCVCVCAYRYPSLFAAHKFSKTVNMGKNIWHHCYFLLLRSSVRSKGRTQYEGGGSGRACKVRGVRYLSWWLGCTFMNSESRIPPPRHLQWHKTKQHIPWREATQQEQRPISPQHKEAEQEGGPRRGGCTFMQTPAVWDKVYFCLAR